MSHADNSTGLPAERLDVPEIEQEAHRELVLRHIDFITTLLAADQELQPWAPTCGCPRASPERIARKRGESDTFPCQYTIISRATDTDSPRVEPEYHSACICRDPLVDSDDPLDAVAAIALSTEGRSIAERYVNRRWRAVAVSLREEYGTWGNIESLSRSKLGDAVETARGCRVAAERVDRLYEFLDNVASDERVDGVSLRDLAPRPYSALHGMLSSYTGISETDGWWLILTAFDKPVWPVAPAIDRLLCDLGLLDPADAGSGERHRELEEELIDRQIPALHRMLAGHAARGMKHLGDENCEARKFSLTFRARKQAEHRSSSDRPVALDLFSGAGGISYGLLEAGYDIALAVDNDQYATDTYRLNHPELPHRRVRCEDITDLLGREDWPELLPDQPDIMVGGPPCQSLSLAGYRSRRADDSDYNIREDPRTSLYTRYLDAVNELQPKAIVLENVEGMADEIEDSDERVVDQVINELESDDQAHETAYKADYTTVDCSEYGIPQRRNRIIVFGVREDLAERGHTPESFFEKLFTHKTVDEDDNSPYWLKHALSGLPKLHWDEGGDVVLGKPAGSLSEYVTNRYGPFGLVKDTDLTFNHCTREHPMPKDRTLFKIMDPGDTGWYIKYKKEGGKWGHLIEYDVGTEENPAFTDKYRMIHWDEPAPTVVAHLEKDANNYIVPDYYEYEKSDENRRDPARNRGVTPREAARIQSFPDDYIFLGPFTSQFRQIGNAVPPILAWHLVTTLQETILRSSSETATEASTEPREVVSSDD